MDLPDGYKRFFHQDVPKKSLKKLDKLFMILSSSTTFLLTTIKAKNPKKGQFILPYPNPASFCAKIVVFIACLHLLPQWIEDISSI